MYKYTYSSCCVTLLFCLNKYTYRTGNRTLILQLRVYCPFCINTTDDVCVYVCMYVCMQSISECNNAYLKARSDDTINSILLIVYYKT